MTEDGTLRAAGDDYEQGVSGILAATEGKKVTAVAAGGYHTLAVVREQQDDCGPLKPQQICASFLKSTNPQDTYVLYFKVGDDEQQLATPQREHRNTTSA